MSAANNLTAEYPPNGVVGFAVLMTLVVTGILGNALVCMTIIRARFMHTTTNYLIAHLALADLLVCATFLAFQEHFIQSPNEIEDPLLCVLFKNLLLVWFMVNVSIASMVLVTFERYIAIVHPLHYPRYLSSRRVQLVIAGIWLLSAPLASIHIFLPNTTAYSEGCLQDLTLRKNTVTALYVFLTAVYTLPMLSLFYCYGRIMINLHRSARQHRGANAGHAEDLNRAQRKVSLVLLTVAVVYIIVWVTVTLSNIFLLFFDTPGSGVSNIVNQLYSILLVFNSVINPIIYAFRYKDLHTALTRVVQ
ncbi:substance-K receptor-like [Acanthaster planci]|uniref:Substance-K receptor-like n=1 Tax=Acanthaster planci TaxID=133434 RepID=A0A8B7YND8_ACAPL|nr:substance-K receptor-like [Acanthaster planci]